MEVTVRSEIDGREWVLTVNPQATVGSLTNMLEADFAAAMICYRYEGDLMENNKKLESYGIELNSTIELTMSDKGFATNQLNAMRDNDIDPYACCDGVTLLLEAGEFEESAYSNEINKYITENQLSLFTSFLSKCNLEKVPIEDILESENINFIRELYRIGGLVVFEKKDPLARVIRRARSSKTCEEIVHYLIEIVGVSLQDEESIVRVAISKFKDDDIQFPLVRYLCEHGAIPCESALKSAIMQNSEFSLLKYLIDRKQNSFYETLWKCIQTCNVEAADYVVSLDRFTVDDNYTNPIILWEACRNGMSEIVLKILIKKFSINCVFANSRTLLMAAAEGGSLSTVLYLLQQGVDPSVVDSHLQWNALFYSNLGGHIEISKALLSTDPSLKLHKDTEGHTASAYKF